MTRETDADFESLVEFATNYSVNSSAINPAYRKSLKLMHRKYHGFMTFAAELEGLRANSISITPLNAQYLTEANSDLGQSLFCWLHGAYKPASLMLRSSIETFVKSVSSNENPAILTEKSVSRVFDLANQTAAWQGGIKGKLFHNLRDQYSKLCLVTHTGSHTVMAQVTALNSFPHFESVRANSLAKQFADITDHFIASLLATHMSQLSKFHFRNRGIILNSIPKAIKAAIMN